MRSTTCSENALFAENKLPYSLFLAPLCNKLPHLKSAWAVIRGRKTIFLKKAPWRFLEKSKMACYIVFGGFHRDFQNNFISTSLQLAPPLNTKKLRYMNLSLRHFFCFYYFTARLLFIWL